MVALVFGSGPLNLRVTSAENFTKLEISDSRFTAEKVGLLPLELEKAANFLALFSYQTHAVEIKKGNQESRRTARRYLSLALQMDPRNLIASRINQMLADGTDAPIEADLPQQPKAFAGSAVRLARQLQARKESNSTELAGFLCLVAADLDPANEDAVYAAEIFERKVGDLSAAWKTLALGKAAGE